MNNDHIESTGRKPYLKPRLKTWGTVADLTRTGITNCGSDFQSYAACPDGGSVPHDNK
jgi:hypothetical protein